MKPFANDLSKAISRYSILRKSNMFSHKKKRLCDSSKWKLMVMIENKNGYFRSGRILEIACQRMKIMYNIPVNKKCDILATQ
jgi:hypothetical protein